MPEASPQLKQSIPTTLDLPGYFVDDPDTSEPHASIVFSQCKISRKGVQEILQVNRQQVKDPVMYFDFPTKIWEKRQTSNPIKHHIAWQDDYDELVNPALVRLGDLYYDSQVQICTGQAFDQGDGLIFRPCIHEYASHVLAKVSWCVLELDDNSWRHEKKAGRLAAQYLQETRQKFGAMLYYRATSLSFPYGADYWVFPLS